MADLVFESPLLQKERTILSLNDLFKLQDFTLIFICQNQNSFHVVFYLLAKFFLVTVGSVFSTQSEFLIFLQPDL